MRKIVLPGIVLLLLIATNQMLAQAPQTPTPAAADTPTNSAVTDLLRRAEAGDADAQVSLGRVYFEARGVAQNFAEGAKWFRKAAEQGNADAQNNLGVAYVQGKGVPKDGREGATWYQRAADQGHVMAQMNLAQGVNQRGHWNHMRPSEATEVEGLGRDLPDFSRRVRTFLTSDQITDCDRQADAWLVANPPPPFGN